MTGSAFTPLSINSSILSQLFVWNIVPFHRGIYVKPMYKYLYKEQVLLQIGIITYKPDFLLRMKFRLRPLITATQPIISGTI